jgi:hypothetical protein
MFFHNCRSYSIKGMEAALTPKGILLRAAILGIEEGRFMKKGTLVFTVAITALAYLFICSSGAMAAKGDTQGPPDGGTGDSGTEPPDYGDLFILYRDADGIPILTEDFCQQPLAAAAFEGCLDIPGTGDCRLIPVDPDTCAVLLGFEIYTQEVDFGRMNEARSADSVFEAQLEDATTRLATAGCISLDPSGRLVASSNIDGFVETGTIDSPLQNLAIYRQLMREGSLGEAVDLPADWLITSARALGAASDKAGKVGIDLVVYINEIMGLTERNVATMLEKECIEVKKEVTGTVQMVEKCFLIYEDAGNPYNYDRRANFGQSLPNPPYIPADVSVEGWFEYLAVLNENQFTFQRVQGPILDAVPELKGNKDLEASRIGGFAQTADDTRATIEFMHSWPLPADYATQVSCDVSGALFYDVSISDVSGLQVPVRMVADTEGREGTVTVANAGPAEATGSLMVYGVDADGYPIGPFYMVADGAPTDQEIFTVPEEFILPAGYSQSWTFFFSMDKATTITWTAEAIAADDVNPSNNTVSEVTVVTRKKGGGR